MFDFTTKFDIDDIVFYNTTFKGLLPMRVTQINFRYYEDNQSGEMVQDVYYTIRNKQEDEKKEYVEAEQLFRTEAQAVAKCLKEIR